MKKLIFVIMVVVITTAILSSCGSRSGKRVRNISETTTKTILLSQEEYDSLTFQAQQARSSNEYNERLVKYIDDLKKNPEFFLLILDFELSATEKKREPFGSFSDYFIPTIHEALEAGVSRVEIQKRINKLAKLAEQGLFISTYEEELFQEGGTKAVIEAIGLDQ